MQLLGPRPPGLTRSQPVFALHGPNAATELGCAALLQVGLSPAPLSTMLFSKFWFIERNLLPSESTLIECHTLSAGHRGCRCTAADAPVGSPASEAALARRCRHCRQHSSTGAAVQGGADGSRAAPAEPGTSSGAGSGGDLVEPCRLPGVWCKLRQHTCNTGMRSQQLARRCVQLQNSQA